jgi:meiotic recombination protein REC8
MLEDDPEFDLNPDLPAFHFDDEGNLVVPQSSQSQASRKTSSQLSPLQPDGSFSGSNRSILGGFDLSQSPFGGGIIPEPFGTGTMTPHKENDGLMPFGEEERELQALDDWGFEIDADGNIIPALDEPQLPRLPQPDEHDATGPLQQAENIQLDDQGDVIMSGGGHVFHSDPPLPVLEELEENQAQNQEQQHGSEEQEVAVEEEASSGRAPVRVQRKRRRPILEPDDQTKITRQELKAWSTNYLANAEQAIQPRHNVTAAEARKNAFNLVFGRGIAGIGFPTGIPGLPHPLTPHFAGEGLQARLLGIVISNPEDEDIEAPRGRRRSALEALDLDQGDAERRVRRRLNEDEDSQHAQPQPEDDAFLPPQGEDELPPVEIGRRAASVLPDIPSDVPWNRPSSQIPSSSIKGAGSRPPSRQVSASPLHGRGSLLIPGPEIERFSDGPQPFLGSDGFGSDFAALHSGPAGSLGSDPRHPDPFAHGSGGGGGTQDTSQMMRTALDREGRNFLDYVESVARDKGVPDEEEASNNSSSGRGGGHAHAGNNARQWVEFGTLFEVEDQKRAVVAQAFYHVLSLATKNVIKIKQDGQGGFEPFGTIRLGVEMAAVGDVAVGMLEGLDDDDEHNNEDMI